MTTERRILVIGFLKDIQKTISNNKIMPSDLVELCITFYSIQEKIFFRSKDASTILMVNGESISKLTSISEKSEPLSSDLSFQSGCYIANISSMIDITNTCLNIDITKKYDGIVTISEEWQGFQMTNWWDLTLFESSVNNNTCIECYSFQSKQKLHNSYLGYGATLNYFEDIESIFISSKHYTIHWLKLKDIDLYTKDFNYNAIKLSNDIPITDNISSVGSIYGENKLFAMTPVFKILFELRGYGTSQTHSDCGIVDLHEMKWVSLNSFACKKFDKNDCWMAEICKNNKYDMNKQYIVSNVRQTAYLDLCKNKWIVMIEKLKSRASQMKQMVWMSDNPFIIYWTDYVIKHRWLDVRDNKYKWIKNDEMNQTMSMIQEYDHEISNQFFL